MNTEQQALASKILEFVAKKYLPGKIAGKEFIDLFIRVYILIYKDLQLYYYIVIK